jgi:4-amino-4-deoxy-L-arabinose transferase-like glycosyltransferase
VALVAYGALAFGYAVLTPAWENPDEPAHYNYVAFVAETGGLPELKPGDWDSALLERVKNGTLQPGDSIGAIQYENWQPPLFYLLAAPVYRLGDTAAALERLRLFDALLGALTLVVGYATARRALPAVAALALPLTLAGIPMFTAVSAGLSADPLANLLSASVLLLLVVRLRHVASHDGRWAVTTGATIGFGLLTKLAVGIYLPLALAVIAIRSTRVLREAAILLAVASALCVPWLVHQVTTYGLTDPLALTRHAAVVADQPRFPGLSAGYVGDFLTISFHSFWAQFGWMAIVAPIRLYAVWGLVSVLAALGLAIERRRFADPVWRLMLGTTLVAFVAYVGYNLSFEQFQARYLFTGIVAIALLMVAGWSKWWGGRAALLVSVALVVLNGYALFRVLVPGFASAG